MKILESVAQMKSLREQWRVSGEAVGFVPTMGALHSGHISLVQTARQRSPRVVASIFVNPTQFNDSNDLKNYPQPIDSDLNLLREHKVDAVFLPNSKEIYADSFRFEVSENSVSQELCGPRRPGHFTGVLTVVLKLFNIVQPQMAYFGEKDFQQLRLIQDMVKALFLDITVVPCATVRESDGLAMSSRNTRLTPEQRRIAPQIYRALTDFSSLEDARAHLQQHGFNVEYLEEHWGRRFVAAGLGTVRLIDNVTV